MITTGALILAATLPIVFPSLAKHSYEYALDNGRHTTVTITKDANTTDWLVLVPGSGCKKFLKFDPFDNLRLKRAFNTLIISKAGAELDEADCRKDEFQRSSVRSQRILDNQTIMRDLIPANSRIFLAGYSEGGYIAPDIAVADPRVKALLSFSGSTQNWMTEEIMCVDAGPKRDALQKKFETQVIGNNSFTEFYNEDWSYAYLNSYITRRSFEMMKQLTIPVLWLNGDHDDILWIDGARQDAMDLINIHGKTNIEYHFIAGAGHDLKCAKTAPTCDPDLLKAQIFGLIEAFAQTHF